MWVVRLLAWLGIVYLSFLVFGLAVCLPLRGFFSVLVARIVAETTTKILFDFGLVSCALFSGRGRAGSDQEQLSTVTSN